MKLKSNLTAAKPNYPVKIIQFGEGNFLRAFADWIVDEMNRKAAFGSGIIIVQPIREGMAQKLKEQDCLYTLYLQGIREGKPFSSHTVITSVMDAINPFDDYESFISQARNPELRFVISNTTEAGIRFESGDVFVESPDIAFPGKVTVILNERFRFFNGDMSRGLIFLPCELIDKNGEILKKCVLEYADLWNLGNGFTDWINKSCIFCNTLVDRIVPGYPKDRISEVNAELGYEDSLVVEAEDFHLWVIEAPEQVRKEFPAVEAGLNVLFTDDLTPYRTRKVRILNGAHTTMTPAAFIAGIKTVREAVTDNVFGEFVRKAVFEEIIPTLDLPESELKSYAEDVITRFKNPFINHYLSSIALNSMSKFETRVLPSLLEYKRRTGKLPRLLVFSLAALIAYYRGECNGNTYEIKDSSDIVDLYRSLWGNPDIANYPREVVEKVLAYEKNWKMNLNDVEGLTESVTKYLTMIVKSCSAQTLKEMM